MTTKTAALLADPHPNCHIVYPYTDPRLVAAAVSLFAAGGLSRDEVVILIATPENRQAINACLEAERFDLESLTAEGRLVCLDAAGMLDQFMVDGMPEPERFDQVVGPLIAQAKLRSPRGLVRLFGEMVSLLWGNDHNVGGAARLEDLWNGVIDRYSVPLLCTYALDGACSHDHAQLPDLLLERHTYALVA
jgi:hypothetical protein